MGLGIGRCTDMVLGILAVVLEYLGHTPQELFLNQGGEDRH